MNNYFIFVLLFVVSCGQQPGSSDDSGKPAVKFEEKEPVPAEDVEQVIQYRRDLGKLTLMVPTSKDMPECTMSNDQQLVYVTADEAFYNCDNAAWIEVDVKGEAGAAGANGEKGDKGDTGENGKDGENVSGNIWYDTVTKRTWIIGTIMSYNNYIYYGGCSAGWRLPTRTEAIAATLHGLGTASNMVDGPNTIWTSDVGPTNPTTHGVVLQISNAMQELEKARSEAHGIVCVEIQ